jgi:hypothetical protein
VDCSYPACVETPAAAFPNPPTESVDCFITPAYTKEKPRAPESTDGVGGIVHIQPTVREAAASRIPPTGVGGSFIPCLQQAGRRFPNPTDGVGGSFIPCLPKGDRPAPESHRRSRWIVHTLPTSNGTATSRIPPTESVDRSYPAYQQRDRRFPNPTDGVGGSFIPCLPKRDRHSRIPPTESVDRSYPAYQKRRHRSRIPPTESVDRSYPAYQTPATASRIPPTESVDRSYPAYHKRDRHRSRIPPTESVDRSYPAYHKRDRHSPNPTDGVGGSFIPCLPQTGPHFPESHRRVGGSFIPCLPQTGPHFPNPTDGVGGLFIPCLPQSGDRFPNPTDGVGGLFIPCLPRKRRPPSRIPPTESVDCSYPAYDDTSRSSESHRRSCSYPAYRGANAS